MPSFTAASLFASVLVSAVGMGFFLYGKRQSRPIQLVAGLALMVFPYFVGSATWMLTIAGLIVGGVWFALKLGM